MDKQLDPLPPLAETNGRAPLPSPISVQADADDEQVDLGRLVAVVRRRGWLMAQVAIATIMVGGGLLLLLAKSKPPEYVGQFQLLVEPITADEQLARSSTQAQGPDVTDAQRIDINQSSLDYESQIRILQGPKLLGPVIKQVSQRYPDVTYENLLKNLKIARITTLTPDKKQQGTKLIDVSYQDPDPEKVKLVLEQLSQTYLNYSLKERQSTIRRGIQFIDSQLPPLRQRVETLQGQIQALRERYTLVDPEQQGQQLTVSAGQLDQTRADNQTQLAEVKAKRDTLAQQLQAANPQSVLGETTYYQTLLEQYQEIEGQIAVESARLKPGHPTMQALLEKRQNLQTLLNREASRVVDKAADPIAVAEARNQAISQAQAQIDQKIQQLPAIARQYSDLQRELTLATDSLNKFSTRQEALQIDAAQQEIPWELTIPPRLELDEMGQPVQVNSVKKTLFLVVIIMLSVLLGGAAGLLVEATQDVLHSPDDLKRISRLALLGVIPHNDPARGSRRAAGQGSGLSLTPPVAEAFRSLYKNIRLLSKTAGPIRSLTLTSAETGDGKSTIALHFAITAAALGQRILLVDADLRQPRIHQLLGLPNQEGLSTLLTEDRLTEDREVQTLLQPCPASKNLMVLTAGPPPLEPVEALTSHRMESLCQTLQPLFDLVIFDTPPLIGLADSGLVAAQTDSLAIVVRLGQTNRTALAAALEELKFSSTDILGVIANDAPKIKALPSAYYTRKGIGAEK